MAVIVMSVMMETMGTLTQRHGRAVMGRPCAGPVVHMHPGREGMYPAGAAIGTVGIRTAAGCGTVAAGNLAPGGLTAGSVAAHFTRTGLAGMRLHRCIGTAGGTAAGLRGSVGMTAA